MNDQSLNENAEIFKTSLVNLCSNLHYLCKDVAHSHGISLKLANLLEIIYEQNGITLNNLCRKIDEDKGNLSRLVNDLMKKDYIIKKQSEYDKRVYYIYLTEYGKEAILKLKRVCIHNMDSLLSILSEEERNLFIKSLKLLDNHVHDLVIKK
ncbi:winged helix-turn-helix transcriptional regulator [Staphylococcus lentus]|uniref:MarR family winged helix-turn-helix transcriptional regulator n=1 Tax=Mammaliicoccus lentus TaxID=42858 RepID=UPI001883997A|nr:MarR family winged helix-turn-helix transcriptional regulator [Mammaliicoccus lentus]MBF0841052.1 winged helix-turn-helix transcriptional regulator [Mammaliicoccus lentus]